MKITLVSLKATEAQKAYGCPELTSEMLCAVGARYSRNDEGIDVILELVGKKSQDEAVDSIFKMVDYGHASIADMAPIPIFIDQISIWLIYYIWSICPRASGQETSTRYVKFDESGILSAYMANVPINKVDDWNAFIAESIRHYKEATEFWTSIANIQPKLVRIPEKTLELSKIEGKEGHKARLTIERLKRNFVFDRARYFIPVAALTNVMLVMPARDWVELTKVLGSHYIREANVLALRLKEKLELVVPRLLKHCSPTKDSIIGHIEDLKEDSSTRLSFFSPMMLKETIVNLETELLTQYKSDDLRIAFKHHTNRYARIGRAAQSFQVKFSITGIAMAELRDLNRHRTGYKFTPSMPIGFYGAEDQLLNISSDRAIQKRLDFGQSAYFVQANYLSNHDSSHPYWGLLGTRYFFEHGTTLDKLAYEIALRTGPGSHFKYAEHMHKVHALLIQKIPSLAGKILVGSAEPE